MTSIVAALIVTFEIAAVPFFAKDAAEPASAGRVHGSGLDTVTVLVGYIVMAERYV